LRKLGAEGGNVVEKKELNEVMANMYILIRGISLIHEV
jgi:hypothetical protein